MRTIVWFREKDLRLADHEPLHEARGRGEVIPVFVLEPSLTSPQLAARRPHHTQFLLDSLRDTASALNRLGSRLLLVAGRPDEALGQLTKDWKVDRVLAHGFVDPSLRKQELEVRKRLGDQLETHGGETLQPPGSLRNGTGAPYAVFTPFARAFRSSEAIAPPIPKPRSMPPLPAGLRFDSANLPTIETLGVPRNPNLLPGGERAARGRLRHFMKGAASRYESGRDRMDLAGTSRLSADLKFGTLSVRQVWTEVRKRLGETRSGQSFLNEICWREFAHSTLWDRPELLHQPFRPAFQQFVWNEDDDGWRAWVEGRTGYPIVDAAARQLLGEGFVHNRARMIAASFLCKHLLINYQRGEAHYMRYLTDGDAAQNNAGWQWSAGCGCDAQPYFRVFNPTLQGKRFDPAGDYVRRWVPELKHMPTRYIHEPWRAPTNVQSATGIELGRDYPAPIVDHQFGRRRFLERATPGPRLPGG